MILGSQVLKCLVSYRERNNMTVGWSLRKLRASSYYPYGNDICEKLFDALVSKAYI